MTSHVSTVEPQKKFSANFIPHEAGRHRIDVKFNGEKIGLARFVEVGFYRIEGFIFCIIEFARIFQTGIPALAPPFAF